MPDGWRNSRWRAIIRGAIPFILWQLTFILSLFFERAFTTLPIILFCCIYSYVRRYWFLQSPSGLFEPAWPAARTRLVLLMAAIPAWGLSMAVGVALWPLAKYLLTKAMRRKRGGWRLRDVHPNGGSSLALSAYPMATTMSEGSGVQLSGDGLLRYLSGHGAERALPGDHRYKPDAEAALKAPKSGGYHDGTNVFIAAMFTNNIEVHQGHPIYRNKSNRWDGTAELLDEWKGTLEKMGVAHFIRTRDQQVPRPPDVHEFGSRYTAFKGRIANAPGSFGKVVLYIAIPRLGGSPRLSTRTPARCSTVFTIHLDPGDADKAHQMCGSNFEALWADPGTGRLLTKRKHWCQYTVTPMANNRTGGPADSVASGALVGGRVAATGAGKIARFGTQVEHYYNNYRQCKGMKFWVKALAKKYRREQGGVCRKRPSDGSGDVPSLTPRAHQADGVERGLFGKGLRRRGGSAARAHIFT
ncbi:hypothetical protein DFH09DRAFT_1459677 [Mycena vulgaris]|nr:hypothetical protein DFH09DRAFT_1459677 [Mycena vulgaris]